MPAGKETVSFQEPCRSVFGGASGPHVAMSLLVPSLGDSHGAVEKFSGPPTLPSPGHAADVSRGEAARKPGVPSHCPPRDYLRPAGVRRVACAALWAGAWRSYFLAAESRRGAAVALPGLAQSWWPSQQRWQESWARDPQSTLTILQLVPNKTFRSTFTMNERGDFLD